MEMTWRWLFWAVQPVTSAGHALIDLPTTTRSQADLGSPPASGSV